MSKPNLPELPAPFEPDWPDLNPHALGCGVEDRGIVNRYEAAEYGFQDGVDKAAQCVPEDIYTGEQMRAYAEEAVRQALECAGDIAYRQGYREALEIAATLVSKRQVNGLSTGLGSIACAIWSLRDREGQIVYLNKDPPCEVT